MKLKSRLLAPLSILIFCVCCLSFPVEGNAQDSPPLVDRGEASPTTTITAKDLEKLPTGNRDLTKLVGLAPDPAAGPAPKLLPDTASGYLVNVSTVPGVHTIRFTTPLKDVIQILVPNQIQTGGSFTGTMKVIPGPGSALESHMEDFTLRIDNQKFPLSTDRFGTTVPGGSGGTMRLVLLGPTGKEVGGVELPVSPATNLPPGTEIPTSGTSGDVLLIRCPCTGTVPPDAYFNINGLPMRILTATAGTVAVRNNFVAPGIFEIETNVGGVVQTTKFRNITLKVSADKLDLMKGETTQLHIVVSGLQQLQAPARMTIDASGVIRMGGGNSQSLVIEPTAVTLGGTYSTDNTLTALSAGTFGVKVVVSVDKEKF